MSKLKREPFIYYDDALEGFAEARKTMNEIIEKKPETFKEEFDYVKYLGASEDPVAMDLLAYYYKTGISGLLKENYKMYIFWELLSASRGNEFAIEKLQFLIGYAVDKIMACEDYQKIVYKNDIDDSNGLYVIGKALCKIIVKQIECFPVDLAQKEDEYLPYKQEYFINLRTNIDEAIPETIKFLKS